jgi:hypothetical protein
MEAGDKIRIQLYVMGYPAETEDITVEEFRYCLGFFKSPEHRRAERFTPLCEMFEPGPDSKQGYISNFGNYHSDMVQAWMDIPK